MNEWIDRHTEMLRLFVGLLYKEVTFCQDLHHLRSNPLNLFSSSTFVLTFETRGLWTRLMKVGVEFAQLATLVLTTLTTIVGHYHDIVVDMSSDVSSNLPPNPQIRSRGIFCPFSNDRFWCADGWSQDPETSFCIGRICTVVIPNRFSRRYSAYPMGPSFLVFSSWWIPSLLRIAGRVTSVFAEQSQLPRPLQSISSA